MPIDTLSLILIEERMNNILDVKADEIAVVHAMIQCSILNALMGINVSLVIRRKKLNLIPTRTTI